MYTTKSNSYLGSDELSSSPSWALSNTPSAFSAVDEPPHSTAGHIAHKLDTMELNHNEENLEFTNTVTEDFTLEFFRPLIESDEKLRAEALGLIIEMLKKSLESPNKELIRAHFLTIVRYSREAPFDDITAAFQDILKMIEKTGEFTIPKSISPSFFISKSLFPPVNTDDESIRQMFVEMFLISGRVSHLNRVLGLHPSYFEKYYEAYNFIMRQAGPLPQDWRNYIAILAASRLRCRWLVTQQEIEFKANDGDPTWLKGIDYIPKKLSSLLEINQILCHQPWLLTKDHIAPLVRGEDSWSIGELVHAMIIICTFKALAGIVYGCGVTPEVDFPDSASYSVELSEEEENEVSGAILADTEKIAELLKGGWQDESEEQQESAFVKAESMDLIPASPLKRGMDLGGLLRYTGKQYTLQHEDFDVKSKTYGIFRIQDYGWKEDGFELARRFLPGAATLLDEEFDHINSMTYNMFSQNANVDTFPFRRAVWQYVQRVKGMFHDDYNYSEVNVFLNRATKAYIKKIVCYADEMTKSDYKHFGYELRHDEKVHVALLAVESSKQSELLYGLHAVMKHMYNS